MLYPTELRAEMQIGENSFFRQIVALRVSENATFRKSEFSAVILKKKPTMK